MAALQIKPARVLSRLVLVVSAVMVLHCDSVLSQTSDVTTNRGFHPNGAYAISDIETISTTNGNMMLNIPLASLPAGRGTSPGYTLNLVYNSKLWDANVEMRDNGSDACQQPGPGPCPETPVYSRSALSILHPSSEGGWRFGQGYGLEVINRFEHEPEVVCQPGAEYMKNAYKWKLKVNFPDGSAREFVPAGRSSYFNDGYYNVDLDGRQYSSGYSSGLGPGDCGVCGSNVSAPSTSGMTYNSTDGSNIRLVVGSDGDYAWWNNPWTLYMPDGTHVTGGNAPQRIYDRNDNYIEFGNFTLPNGQPASGIYDQMGRYIRFDSDPVLPYTYIYTQGTNGQELKWTIKWKDVWVYKQYRATDDLDTCYQGGMETLFSPLEVVEEVVLPDPEGTGTQSYRFGYNVPTARPTEGNYTSGWGEINAVTLPTEASAAYQWVMDGATQLVKTQEVLANSPTQKTLTYSQEYDGVSTPATETWTYGFYDGYGSVSGPNSGAIEYSYYNNRGGFDMNGVSYKSIQPGLITERLWWGPGRVKTEYASVPDGAGNPVRTAIKDYQYDGNGNVLQVKEYDWIPYSSIPRGTAPPNVTVDYFPPTGIPDEAVLKRVTNNTYYAPTTRLRNAVKSSEVTDMAGGGSGQVLARTEYAYDGLAYGSTPTKGNLTMQRSWDSTKGADRSNPANYITLAHQYDLYGNRTLTTDARGVQTQFIYGAVGGNTQLYPTETRAALGTPEQQITKQEYDFNTGLVTRSYDANNIATATQYDAFGRPKLVKEAEGTADESRSVTEYNDIERRVITRSDLNTLGDGKLVSVQHYDQLGRVRLTRTLEDAATQNPTDESVGIKVQTRYKDENAYQLVSNSYRAATSSAAASEATMGWTRTTVNSAGRVLEIKYFIGGGLPAPWGTNENTTGAATTSYNGEYTTVVDQAQKRRRTRSDGLGRLVRVDEPNAAGDLGTFDSPAQATSYTYDAQSNLTEIVQDGQTRSFGFSSLSRLTSATTPESGGVSYRYDGNGNLEQKTDARGVVTTHTYDAHDRLLTKSYSDGTPQVTYTYDAAGVPNSKGRLTSVGSSVSTTNYTAYDVSGQITGSNQVTDNVTYVMSYGYDRAGNLTAQTYPSGRVVTTAYDVAGRMRELTGQKSGEAVKTYASSLNYTAHGAVGAMRLGNNLWEHTAFNSRYQPTEIGLGSSSTDSGKLRLGYDYGTIDNIGSIKTQTITAPGVSLTQGYTYDWLNRLETAEETSGAGVAWRQKFGYDRFGNRNYVVPETQMPAGMDVVNALFVHPNNVVNNRYAPNQGYGYDNAGNLTTMPGGGSYAYDGENRQTNYNNGAASYHYDGNAKRVKKVAGSVATVFVYDAGGLLVAEYANETPTSAGTSYFTDDHLGSNRLVSDASGAVKARHDYLPFGEELCSGTGGRSADYKCANDPVRQKFTGKERDSETGLDYFLARYYSGKQGRFTSPDEFAGGPDEFYDFGERAADNPTFYAELTNPQSLNKYQYTYNNPINLTDDTGHCPPCLAPVLAPTAVEVLSGAAAVFTYLILNTNSPTPPQPSLQPVPAHRSGQIEVTPQKPQVMPSHTSGQVVVQSSKSPTAADKPATKQRRTGRRNIEVRHSSKKRAREAAEHPHPGKKMPTPSKSDKKKRDLYDEQQKYRKPERDKNPNSKHPDSHFHDRNKSRNKKVNRHHTYPQ